MTVAAGRSEEALLKLYGVQLPKRKGTAGRTDVSASGVLRLFHPVMLESYRPLSVLGDGNCLYRAISRGLYGSEDHHLHLRLLAAIEIAQHPLCYDASDKRYIDHVRDRRLWHDPYQRLLTAVTSPGEFQEYISIYAVSAALGLAIKSYYPPTSRDGPHQLDRIVRGRGVRKSAGPGLTVMWTTTFIPKSYKDYRPNHFVVLQDLEQPDVIDLVKETSNMAPSSPVYDQEFPPLTKSDDFKTPVRQRGFGPRKLSLQHDEDSSHIAGKQKQPKQTQSCK